MCYLLSYLNGEWQCQFSTIFLHHTDEARSSLSLADDVYGNCKCSAEYKQLGHMVKSGHVPDKVLLEPCGISLQPPTITLTNAFFILII